MTIKKVYTKTDLIASYIFFVLLEVLFSRADKQQESLFNTRYILLNRHKDYIIRQTDNLSFVDIRNICV